MGMGMGGMGGMGGGMGSMGIMPFLGMGMMNSIPGGNEALFKQALQNSMTAGMSSQHHVLVPNNVLQQALIPKGYLSEIANRCQIRIELGQDVQPNLRQLTFCGGVAANAVAVYFLQERLLQLGN